MNASTKNYNFEALVTRNPDRQERAQLKLLYDFAFQFEKPSILELGTQSGVSTTVFLQACNQNDGNLTSVDIDDCASVSTDPRFHFVQSDSTNAAYILERAPHLAAGIDVLYVDTLHERHHVEKEIAAWWPLLREGSAIIFDDVDPHNYRPGQGRDKIGIELNNEGIFSFVEDIFRADMKRLELQLLFGSTGKAVLRKYGPMGEPFSMPSPVKKRDWLARLTLQMRRKASPLVRKIRGRTG